MPKMRVHEVAKLLDKSSKEIITKLKEQGVEWGFDIPYLLTGIFNSHPSSAINFIKEGRTDYSRLQQELMDMD